MTQKFYQDEQGIFNITFYSDEDKLIPVDPSTVTLEIQKPNGTVTNPTVNLDGARPANVGKHTASYIFVDYGLHDWRWITTGPINVRQGTINVERKSTS